MIRAIMVDTKARGLNVKNLVRDQVADGTVVVGDGYKKVWAHNRRAVFRRRTFTFRIGDEDVVIRLERMVIRSSVCQQVKVGVGSLVLS